MGVVPPATPPSTVAPSPTSPTGAFVIDIDPEKDCGDEKQLDNDERTGIVEEGPAEASKEF